MDTDQLHTGMMEWHTSLVSCDILQILGGFSDTHTLNGLEPLDLHDLWGFLGQVYCAPFLEITSDPVGFMMMAIVTCMTRHLIVVLIYISLVLVVLSIFSFAVGHLYVILREMSVQIFGLLLNCVLGILNP